MAVGRPILYIGPPGSTPWRTIERHQCGWNIQPGDSAGLVRLLHRLAANREEIAAAGAAARAAFEAHYDLPQGVARVQAIVEHEAARGPVPTMFRLPSLRLSGLILLGWLAFMAALVAASLLPPAALGPLAALDHRAVAFNHFFSFALLAAVPCALLNFRRHRAVCAGAVVLLGFVLELLQAFTPGHTPDVNAMIVNCCGATAGWLLAKLSVRAAAQLAH